MEEMWPVRLFRMSYLKQTKYYEILKALGPVGDRHVLEIGSDNGVFSYLFRQLGGSWKSADIDERSVSAMQALINTDVYRLADGRPMPFADNDFDCVIVVDLIEHLEDDSGFIRELYRVLKPGGKLIVNAPTFKDGSLLMRLRRLMRLTEADHGHVRPGYSYADLRNLLEGRFTLDTYQTHTKFFAKLMDTIVVMAVSTLKRNKPENKSGRGVLVTGSDMKQYQSLFRVYRFVYPLLRLVSSLDLLLFFQSGYMLIATGHSTKPATGRNETGIPAGQHF